ncbi:(2Fe-2S)-binding protein [Gemmobacter nectariphilus]|uniref:(2Fe-2S)-binding protein n=1 Tax=Gemmobacter nectariphilus TaxID=220343 RepID=UPI000423F336|nr:(2Fe-2S)-binding protein [Gemmobacter nectariphilus]
MAKKALFTLSLNGDQTDVAAAPDATLLETLRDGLGVLSPKRGCNQGVCGACTVLIDGVPVRSCLTLTARCEGHEISTMEGMNTDPVMEVLQRHMVASGGVQCGFCTSGMLMSARNLLAETPRPDREAVKSALSGNLCRCTGYRTIVDAICTAAEELAQ